MPNPFAWQREFRRSLALFRMCLAVVRSDPRLLLLAVANALVTLVLGVGLLVATLGDGRSGTGDALPAPESALALVLLVGLRIGSTVSNAILVVVAIARLRGERLGLMSAVGVVMSRLPVVAAFSLLAVLVDFVTLLVRKYELPSILSPLGVLQGYMSGIIDAAWQLATFVALPVIVSERAGTVATLRRSRQLIEQRWGAGVAAVVGLRAAGIGLAALGVVVVSAAQQALPGLADVSMMVLYAYIAVVAVVISAIGQVYRAAVYLYAAEGLEPVGFEEQRLRTAFA